MSLWDCDVCDGFGTTEVGALGGHAHTCLYETKDQRRNSNLHFTEDSGIPEILNPKTFEPMPDGENGTIVWSSVSTVSQPILRFNLNDIMNIQSMDCPCGRGLRMGVGGVQGRADDMIHISGVNVFPANIEEAVRSIDAFGNEYRLKLMNGSKGMVSLTVEAEIRPEIPEKDHEKLIKALQSKIFDKCQINPKIESVPYGDLPRAEFKSKRILDLRQ
jgi:phenylacetate-CoA ligase